MKLTADQEAALEYPSAQKTASPSLPLVKRVANWWRNNWSTLLLLAPLLIFMLTIFAAP